MHGSCHGRANTQRGDAWLSEWDRRFAEGERARDILRSIADREELSLAWIQKSVGLARRRRQVKLEARARA